MDLTQENELYKIRNDEYQKTIKTMETELEGLKSELKRVYVTIGRQEDKINTFEKQENVSRKTITELKSLLEEKTKTKKL